MIECVAIQQVVGAILFNQSLNLDRVTVAVRQYCTNKDNKRIERWVDNNTLISTKKALELDLLYYDINNNYFYFREKSNKPIKW